MIGDCVERSVEIRIYEILWCIELVTWGLSEVDESVVVRMKMLRFAPGDGVKRSSKSQALDIYIYILGYSENIKNHIF